MKRRLFNFARGAAAAVSLAVCVSSMVLWVRSYLKIDHVTWHAYVRDDGAAAVLVRRYWVVSSANGGLWVAVDTHTMGPPAYAAHAPGIRAMYPAGTPPRWVSDRQMTQFDLRSFHPVFGFIHSQTRYANPIAAVHGHLWRTPYWAVALLAAILPWRWLALARRWRLAYRKQNRLCLACGYDLRATPEGGQGGRCPECGTPTPAPAPARVPDESARPT